MKKNLKVLGVLAATIMLCFAFISCAPSNLEKGAEKMQKAGYEVTISMSELNPENCDGSLIAMKGLSDGLWAFHFKSIDAATDYLDSLGDSKEHLTQDNKWVYYGSEEAIKAFTK